MRHYQFYDNKYLIELLQHFIILYNYVVADVYLCKIIFLQEKKIPFEMRQFHYTFSCSDILPRLPVSPKYHIVCLNSKRYIEVLQGTQTTIELYPFSQNCRLRKYQFNVSPNLASIITTIYAPAAVCQIQVSWPIIRTNRLN